MSSQARARPVLTRRDRIESRDCTRVTAATAAAVRWHAPRGRGLAAVGPVDDRVLDRADALDLAADAVARLEEDRRVAEDADAAGRAGGDDVAGLQGDAAAR